MTKHTTASILLLLVILFVSGCEYSTQQSSAFNTNKIKKTEAISGKVTKVIDGDTYDLIIEDGRVIRIRMKGIDAPEKGMPFYYHAKNYLKELCLNKEVKIRITEKDKYGRYVAYAYLPNDTELSHAMVKKRYAWHFKEYSSDKTLDKLQKKARSLRIGIWEASNPMPPWRNRSLNRKGISTKDRFHITDKNR